MTDFTREEIRSQLNMQGFDPPEPEFTEVVYRINALIDGLKKLDDLDVYHREPWPVLPYRGLSQRPSGQGPAATNGEAAPHDQNIAFMTIREQANLIRSKKLSPVELTRTYLDRIQRYDPQLHAFNLVLHDEALAEAEKAEKEIASGNYRGPMHGIPIGVKDQFDIKGHPNTGGCDAYSDNIATEDCTIIARFRQAGAIVMGSLATHEFHMGGTLEFLNKEAPRNPWDLNKSPAGSSAGSGASVAAGLLSGAMGGDTGGSIRGPGSVNGIAGMRPSWSRLSRQGIFTLSWELDTAGPLARSAEDTAIMLQAIAGYDPNDPTTSQDSVPDYSGALTGDIKGMRVGVLEQMMGDDVQQETKSIVTKAIDELRELGATVEPVSIPLIQKMQGPGIADDVDPAHKPVLVDHRITLDDPVFAAPIDEPHVIEVAGSVRPDASGDRRDLSRRLEVVDLLEFLEPALQTLRVLDERLELLHATLEPVVLVAQSCDIGNPVDEADDGARHRRREALNRSKQRLRAFAQHGAHAGALGPHVKGRQQKRDGEQTDEESAGPVKATEHVASAPVWRGGLRPSRGCWTRARRGAPRIPRGKRRSPKRRTAGDDPQSQSACPSRWPNGHRGRAGARHRLWRRFRAP